MENNNMISFGELINECFIKYEVYIPLIQRNYKWDKETATRLVSDLWNSYKQEAPIYTAGMITLYKEDENRMQLIDGQQRVITLFILLKILEPDKTDFNFKFERDEGVKEEKKRFYFLGNINKIYETEDLYTDLTRFRENYIAMKSEMEVEDRIVDYQSFKEYILKSLFFLLHISEVEPFDEFINLNKNKTRFVISDRIKANLIIDSSDDKGRNAILQLFKELSEILYYQSDSGNSVWELVSQGYIEESIPKDNSKRFKNKLYLDENRLKLLCCERYGATEYDGFSISGYDKKTEYDILEKHKEILCVLGKDIKDKNYCLYNGFSITHIGLSEKFFSILNKYKGKNFNYAEEYLKRILLQKCNNDNNAFYLSCFIESQLKNGIIKAKDIISEYKIVEGEINITSKKDKNQEDLSDRKHNWINSGVSEFKDYLKIYYRYIRDKYRLQEGNDDI